MLGIEIGAMLAIIVLSVSVTVLISEMMTKMNSSESILIQGFKFSFPMLLLNGIIVMPLMKGVVWASSVSLFKQNLILHFRLNFPQCSFRLKNHSNLSACVPTIYNDLITV